MKETKMTINSEKMSTEMENGIYEQPSLKKYGTMKEITLATAGSGSDAMGQVPGEGGEPGVFDTEADDNASGDMTIEAGGTDAP
jgi:hypothetical protein